MSLEKNLTVELGDSSHLTAFGERLVAQVSPQAAWRFDYGTIPNSRLYNVVTANGGTATIDQSRLLLQTGTNVAGSAQLQSKNRLRYIPGVGGLIRFTAAFSSPKANSQQLIGLGDTQDGFFFGYINTNFGIVRRRDGVDNFENFFDWVQNRLEINPLLGNIYQIRYQWLGYGFISFYIEHPSDIRAGFVPVHIIQYPNTSVLTNILNPTLPLFAEIKNTGNSTNLTLISPSALASIEGLSNPGFNPLDVFNSFDRSASFSDANNNHLITIRNKTTFGGAANRVPIEITDMSIGRSQTGSPLTRIRLHRNATTAIALTYSDIDTNNSPVEASITTTTLTSSTPERQYVLTDTGTTQPHIPFSPGSLILQPGESLTVEVQNSLVQVVEVAATLNWKEMF
jgi:hypothetical protein